MLAISMRSKCSINISFETAIFENTGDSFLLFQMLTKVFKKLFFSGKCAHITELATETEYFRGSHSC